MPADFEKRCRAIIPECNRLIDRYDDHKATELLRVRIADTFPPELVDLAMDRVMQLIADDGGDDLSEP